jgi:hypothetical protein
MGRVEFIKTPGFITGGKVFNRFDCARRLTTSSPNHMPQTTRLHGLCYPQTRLPFLPQLSPNRALVFIEYHGPRMHLFRPKFLDLCAPLIAQRFVPAVQPHSQPGTYNPTSDGCIPIFAGFVRDLFETVVLKNTFVTNGLLMQK